MRNIIGDQTGRAVLFLPVLMGVEVLVYFGRKTEPSLVWSVSIATVAVFATVALWRWEIPRIVCLCAAATSVGFVVACVETARAPPWVALPRHAVYVTGRIAMLEALPQGRRVTIAAAALDDARPLPRAVRVRLRDSDASALLPGDDIRVRALLRAPSPPDYPGGWDTQREAFFTGLAGYGFAIGPAQAIHPAIRHPWTALREVVASRIMSGLPGPDGAIAATLLAGIGTAIPPPDRAAFQDSGLAHLLAVAGLHVGIVMGLAFAASRFSLAAWEFAALHWPTRQIAALAALAAGVTYLALTGAHLPILRSVAMASLATLGLLTGRRAITLRGLAVAATVLMMGSPNEVVGVSFQMSFSAVLALIAGYEIARPALAKLATSAWWSRPALYASGLILTSLLAGTASLPFAIYHFGKATLYYVPANMLAVPLTAFWVMPWGLAALTLMPLHLETLALAPMGVGITLLRAIAHTVAGWPDATLPIPQLPPWSPALVAVGLAWIGLWRGRLRLAGIFPLAIGLILPAFLPSPDILVTANAKLIAIRTSTGILLDAASNTSSFEKAAPARLWPNIPVSTCTETECRADIRGQTILLIRDTANPTCQAALILSTTTLHDACTGVPHIDYAFAHRAGATLIRLAPKSPDIATDLARRGDRPWVIRDKPALPMALTE